MGKLYLFTFTGRTCDRRFATSPQAHFVKRERVRECQELDISKMAVKGTNWHPVIS